MARNAADRDAPGALCLVEVKATDDLHEPSDASGSPGRCWRKEGKPSCPKKDNSPADVLTDERLNLRLSFKAKNG